MAEVILIGFAQADRERIQGLKGAIERYGWRVECPLPAHTVTGWLDELRPQVEAARCVLVAWTFDSVGDRWTAVLADAAQERRTLVSVLLDPVEPPDAFADNDPLDMIGWDGETLGLDMEALALVLGGVLGPPPRGAAAQRERSGTRPAERARARLGPAPVAVLPEPQRGAGARRPRGDTAARAPAHHPASQRRAEPQPHSRSAVAPIVYGWAVAWTLGLSAIALYVREGIDIQSSTSVYIVNPVASAVAGGCVGVLGAAFMVHALRLRFPALSPGAAATILLGWTCGGALGLMSIAWLGLPLLGVAAGIVGFELGWVVCWILGGAIGAACTWLALRGLRPELDRRSLLLLAGGFVAGAVGGWVGSWLLLAMPVMLFSWINGKLIAELAAPEVGEVMTMLIGIALIGAGGGASYGLGGGLMLYGVLTRPEEQGEG